VAESSAAHSNNFGLLRLAFAFFVIVSHSSELIDGDRSREPFTRLFGTISLGDFGVDGFFLVSGYLITQSFENSRTVWSYVWKRVLRIYPAFIAASLVCLLFVAPFSGVQLTTLTGGEWVKSFFRIILLSPPALPGAFSGQPHAALNGSMWTIAYEFRCYVLIAILGLLGVFRRRKVFLSISVASLLLAAFVPIDLTPPSLLYDLFGTLRESLRFTSLFLFGAVFYVYRDKIKYASTAVIVAAPVLIASLFNTQAAALAVPTLGGFLIFWFAFLPNTPRLNAVNRSTDVSYGTYLYAWPVQMLAVRYFPGISPVSVLLIATFFSVALAFLSWSFIEQPFLSLKRAPSRDAAARKTIRSSKEADKCPAISAEQNRRTEG
jgi:peptidoglycan/LPS O-acetylase OafA/YrhL